MKLKIRGADFSTLAARKIFVGFLSATVNAGMTCSFDPYQANSFDDREWIIDSLNNWRVGFSEVDNAVVDIRYRYQCEQVRAEESLASWLEFLVDAEIVL